MSKSSKKKARAAASTGTSWTPLADLIRKFLALGPWQYVQAALIVAASFGVMWPAVNGGWLWDDDFYITQNALLHDPLWLAKIWYSPGSVVNYFPITATVMWAEWQTWGMETFGYHVVNIVLHAISALCVWHLLSRFKLRLAWLGGLIFAVHPTSVESVAWISELKNTLSMPFFIFAACSYMNFDDSRKGRDYAFAIGWFVAAMLTKITMVSFPLVILLFCWWKRGTITWTDLKASLPFFAISIALGLLNIVVLDWYQNAHGIHESVDLGGLDARLARAGLALSFYFSLSFLPWSLTPMYPRWEVDPPHALQFLPWLVLAAIFALVWMKRQTWGRHVALGFGFFLLNLAPFSGFVGNSFMRFTWVMDHFLYLPIIGLIGLVVAGLGWLSVRLSVGPRIAVWVCTAAAVVFMAIQSYSYAAVFQSAEGMWDYTTKLNPNAWLAWSNLGNERSKGGNTEVAVACIKRSLELHPQNDNAYYNLGVILGQAGRNQEAAEAYRNALAVSPTNVWAHVNLGNLLIAARRYPEAMNEYIEAIRSDPTCAAAYNDLGNSLRQAGRLSEAIASYSEALRLNPDFAQARDNYAVALIQSGKNVEGIEQCQLSLKANPAGAQAHNNWAVALSNLGKMDEAEEQVVEALKVDPSNAEAQSNLALLHARKNGSSKTKK